MARIELENVSYSYDGKTKAVENVSLCFPQEGSYSLLGPSGCGKTTLLKIIMGLLQPQQGRVLFDGKDITNVPVEDRDIAMVFQFPVVYPMSCFDNLMFPLRRRKISRKEKERIVFQVAELLEIRHLLSEPANRLGPADAQTVALGRALAKGTSVVLLDEPLSSVEPERRLSLRAKIRRVQEEEKKLFIYVTHDQSEALTLSDKVTVMKDGKVVQYGSKEEIYEDPADVFVGYFIGSPGMNIIKGRHRRALLDFGDFSWPIPAEVQRYLEEDKEIQMGIRPEYVQVSKHPREESLLFTCYEIEEKGRGIRVLYLRSESGRNEIKASGSYYEVSIGDKVWVTFPIDKVKLYDAQGKKLSDFR